ncbi:hypothetical protein B0I35DRAFT_411409 [Stachybotrys elegans]|uniref:Heterokaryon incompatibility domain-containing protein n=1 Tax=Stachybotrys elegans TaxID=80388 RepID=A0A8K0WQK4_9HYPO|nr:hypothetical protein B0I35DRAFT_411409 [Stachybotrys elegans]
MADIFPDIPDIPDIPGIPDVPGLESFKWQATTAMACQKMMRPDPFNSDLDKVDFEVECDGFVQSDKYISHFHIAKYVEACIDVFTHTEKEGIPIEVDRIIHWMVTIQFEMGTGQPGTHPWKPERKASDEYALAEALDKLDMLDICKYRAWTLVEVSDRKEEDLPDIVEALGRFEGSRSLRWLHDHRCNHELEKYGKNSYEKWTEYSEQEWKRCTHRLHLRCSIGKCQAATMDSTLVPNLPSKKPGYAEDVVFLDDKRLRKLEHAVWKGEPTAWALDGEDLVMGETPKYVALSHVWSDGTGHYSHLVWEFLKVHVRPLQVQGIWWDAISLPKSRDLRAKALRGMNENYRKAECTIVHDERLMEWKWGGLQQLCLALVLSTWFTRGWTALELAVSKRVKVLTKKGDGEITLVDLDDEILAFGPEESSHVAWVANSWLRRLREPINDFGDIVNILARRTTSLIRDQSIIAALLSEVPGLDTTDPEARIIEETMQFLGKIPYRSMMHGKPTMGGGFSWCPGTLQDMKTGIEADIGNLQSSDYFGMLDVYIGGSVRGRWRYKRLLRSDDEPAPESGNLQSHLASNDIKPLSSALEFTVMFDRAVNLYPERCLLLSPPYLDDEVDQALLVLVARVGERGDIESEYVGVVSVPPGTTFHDETRNISIGKFERDAEFDLQAKLAKPDPEEESPSVSAVIYPLPEGFLDRLEDLATEPPHLSEDQSRLMDRCIVSNSKAGLHQYESALPFLEKVKKSYQGSDVEELPEEEMRLLCTLLNCYGDYFLKMAAQTDKATTAFEMVRTLYKSWKDNGNTAQSYAHKSIQDSVSEWKRLWLDSCGKLALIHEQDGSFHAATDVYMEVAKHFSRGETTLPPDFVGSDEGSEEGLLDNLRKLLDSGRPVDLGYMDIEKAEKCFQLLKKARRAFGILFEANHPLLTIADIYLRYIRDAILNSTRISESEAVE